MKKTIIKTPEQIDNIRQSGKYLTELLQYIYENSKPGVMLIELEHMAQSFLDRYNLKGAFKGYMGFPANLCLSVNDCVVHGIPDKYVLKDGDLLKIDAGVTYKGGISDSAVSLIIGGDDLNPAGLKLIKNTKEALDISIGAVKAGNYIYDFSNGIYSHMKSGGHNVIKYLTGHGVGVNVHEGPFIYNRPHPDTKRMKFEENMVLALEPITAQKSDDFIEKRNIPWNLYTKNGDLGAQWEYTIVVTKDGYEILSGVV